MNSNFLDGKQEGFRTAAYSGNYVYNLLLRDGLWRHGLSPTFVLIDILKLIASIALFTCVEYFV